MTRLFDTHAHYTDRAFDPDRETLLAEIGASFAARVVIPGCGVQDARMAVALSERFDFVYAAVGVHPHDAAKTAPSYLSDLRALAAHPKVKAMGELGLDYHYDLAPRETQKQVLYAQMELAAALGLPVIFHDREAHSDALQAVRDFPQVRGVFHCYSGSTEMARELIKLGWYLSFTGMVTFPKTKRALAVAADMPLDRLMLETDAPYMAPVPHRGKRCDSRYLPLIAAAVAEARGVSPAEILAKTYENACTFFGLDDNAHLT